MTTETITRADPTPGPWAIGELSDGESTHVCIAPADKLSAGGKGPAVCLISGVSRFTEEDAANALLIAAAPDLLAQLKALRDEYTRVVNLSDYCAHDWDGMYAVDAAVNKAEGRKD
jgi:hypothetical protein